MISCPTKKYLGIDCPGCGIQRSLLSMLKGDFFDAFIYYPGLFPIMVGVGFSVLFYVSKRSIFNTLARNTYIAAGVVILGNWILKLTGVIPCPV
ncbi:MAG: DUF2752 domain-containing protein [Flavobacteriales bacterium]|nr:DUF2752 domain-containing protein [Flavobacteriales bacterium]